MKKSKYEEIVNQGDKLVLVDFFADWCGPCKAMMPSIERVAKENTEKLSVFKINIDKNPALATNLGIRSVPTLLLYRNGKIVWRQVGGKPYHELNSELQIFIQR
jgi:thioredoxin 1